MMKKLFMMKMKMKLVRITADELDFFHGSTTFGRQVAELSGSSRRSRRKSF